ncbi:MAG: hypothetical protein GC178_06210 [Flavobacteriales bacterium]|nr:hypothetical protein [Flavobacteriales bacterium]
MKRSILLIFNLFIIAAASAQVPQLFNYQGVARDNAGSVLAGQAVGLQLSLHSGSPVGTVVYQETHSPTTNQFGLFNIEIGNGAVVSGDLASVDWSTGSYFIQVEMDASGGTSYQDMGTSQLLSVPYALYAGTAGNSITPPTLDQAYDQGGLGAGRTITADTGAVFIDGDDGFIVTGTLNMGDSIEVSGAGTRMFFNPRRAAFRAGSVSGPQWDASETGLYSVALGYNTKATNDKSIAIGSGAISTGVNGVALGNSTNADGLSSVAMGSSSTANGNTSIAIGTLSIASGDRAIALGTYITAKSFNEIAIGRNNTDYVPANTTGWNPGDRLFVVGNGQSTGTTSDAMVILKNGKVGIGSSSPEEKLHVVGSIRMVDGHQQAGYVPVSDANGKMTWTDPATLSSGDDGDWTVNGNDIYSAVSGNVGIGTNTPGALLHVAGSGTNENSGIRVSGATGISVIYMNAAGDLVLRKLGVTDQLVLDESGNVGVGTSAPSSKFHVTDDFANTGQYVASVQNTGDGAFSNGLLITAGENTQTSSNRYMAFQKPNGTEIGAIVQSTSTSVAYNTTSDERLKMNIHPTTKGLTDLMNIEVKDYVYKEDSEKPQTGFIAQQVFDIYPNAVTEGGNDPKSDPWMMDYSKLSPLMVKAIQDLKTEKDELQKQVTQMMQRLEQLEQKQ